MDSSSTIIKKLSEEKISKYKEDMKNKEEMSKKIMNFIINEYEELFPEILIMAKKQFLLNIRKGVFSNLEDLYSDIIKEDTKFNELFDNNFKKIEEKYENNYNLLRKEWTNFHKNKNETNYLCKYRKHCFDDSEYASHNCTNKEPKFILISNNDNIEFVICSKCQKAYKSTFILCKCYHCDEEYYSKILTKDENTELFEATWKEYHCPQMISKKMSCIKCKSPFYLNMKTGMLNCLNEKCKFISKQKRILWTCNNCQKDFTSGAKVYNPLDIEIINKAIKQTLLLKHRAHPNKMPCCKLNIFFTEFYHKKNCKGILYLGEINDKLIIVCEKCHAINYYERFIWTCPKCQTKFRTKNKNIISSRSHKREDISKETYEKEIINKNENKNETDIKTNIKNKKNNENENNEYKNEIKDVTKNEPKEEISIELKEENKGDIKDENNDEKKEDDIKNEDKDEIKNINIIGENKNEIKDEIKNKEESKDIQNENNNGKEDEEDNILRKDSTTINTDSPLKNRNTKLGRNYYQSFRFRRQNRLKSAYNTINIEPDINSKKEQNEEKNENEIENHSSTANSSFLRRRYNISKFNAPDDKSNVQANDINKIEKNENDENNENIEDSPRKRLLNRFKNGEGKKYTTKRRSVFMRNKGLKLQNDEKENNEKDIEKKESDNIKKEYEKEENNKEKKYLKTEIEKEKDINELNKTNNKEKFKKRGPFSRFLFLGGGQNTSGEGNSKNNFEGRKKYRRSSLHNPEITPNIRERISGKKINSRSRSPSSSSSSSNFSNKMNKINEGNKKNNKSTNELKSQNENEIIFFENKENSKKSTKVNSKDKEENKIEINNNKLEEEKENQEEQDEEWDDTQGIEYENKNNNGIGEDSNDLNSTKIPGISDHLLSHITKRINHILANTKINQFNLDDYTFYRKLGEGSYGVIHCLIHEKTKEKFALKKIIAYSLKKIQEFTKEFELVHICQHPNILKIYGLNINILDQTTYALQVLMEKADRDWDKDIKKRIQERRYYTEEELISITRQITSALLYMKEKLNITHRDIKPQNVLIFEGGIYKLADFGEAKEIKVKKNLNTLRGTELYMSPALYNGLKVNQDDVDHDPFKSDLFSLGFCLVYAATMNFNLLYELRNTNDDGIIRQKIKDNLKENYSEKFIGIINKMVVLEEKNRYDFKELSKVIEENYGK